MITFLRKHILSGPEGLKLGPFVDRNLSTLLSWAKTERELRMWAGETFPSLPDEDTFRRHQDKRKINGYQAEDRRGRFAGYAELVGSPGGNGILCRVIIDPARRRMGLGKAFVELLEKEAFEGLRFKNLLLNVFTRNLPAVRCYRSLGFRPLTAGLKQRTYCGERWNLVVMKKTLSTKAA
ncbi:MAG: hypothetical protein CMI32_02175 [Opitutales bacterium]|nr:hypothetical protein [Opitutales bacterium]